MSADSQYNACVMFIVIFCYKMGNKRTKRRMYDK